LICRDVIGRAKRTSSTFLNFYGDFDQNFFNFLGRHSMDTSGAGYREFSKLFKTSLVAKWAKSQTAKLLSNKQKQTILKIATL
jgi:hypothetical protein